MAEQSQEQKHKEEPIIIKKKRGHGGHGHHGGAWKVAYADFVTAMMAFFIVMWILASSEQVKELVSSYFNNPGAFNFITGERTVPIDLDLQPRRGKGDEGGSQDGKKFMISFTPEMRDSIVDKLRQKAIEDSIKAAERVNQMVGELNKLFEGILSQRPNFKDLLNSIKVELTQEGLRIELIESSESVFFEIGSANLKPQAVEILKALGNELGKLPNYIEIEGHTDSRAYSGRTTYTNWELSSDRANAARRILEKSGLWDGQITKVTGFSDRKLRTQDNPFDVSNRRVSILVRHMSVSEFIPKGN